MAAENRLWCFQGLLGANPPWDLRSHLQEEGEKKSASQVLEVTVLIVRISLFLCLWLQPCPQIGQVSSYVAPRLIFSPPTTWYMMPFYQGQDLMAMFLVSSFFFFFNTYWLCWVLVVAHTIFIAACGILLVVACGIFSCSMQTLSCSLWYLVPQPGIEPGPPELKCGVLTTGSPGKSL